MVGRVVGYLGAVVVLFAELFSVITTVYFSRWLAVWLEFLGAVVVLCAALFSVITTTCFYRWLATWLGFLGILVVLFTGGIVCCTVLCNNYSLFLQMVGHVAGVPWCCGGVVCCIVVCSEKRRYQRGTCGIVCDICPAGRLTKHSEGILPKGPYPPCVSMADRALFAG